MADRNFSCFAAIIQLDLVDLLIHLEIIFQFGFYAILISPYLIRTILSFSSHRKSLGARLATTSDADHTLARIGNTQMSFNLDPKAKHLKQRDKELKKHREERKRVIRPIKSLHLKKYVAK